MRPSGTEGYAEEAAALLRQYESIAFADVQRVIIPLLPAPPAPVLDIGAGTGRDAAGFAALGYQVVAVEPTAALRDGGAALHPSARITWLDDSLPELNAVYARGECFDVIMLTAVWMHLDRIQRRRAMQRVAPRLRPGGLMAMTLRHGPVPQGRRMFEVSTAETVALAAAEGLQPVLRQENQDALLRRPGVSWTRLAFRRPA